MTARLHGDRLAREGMLDFAVNIWPLERSARLHAAMSEALASERYPDPAAARAAVAARHDRPIDEVLLTNGACDALWHLALVSRPRRAACVEPCFTEARAAFEAVGASVDSIRRSAPGWSFDPGQVADDVQSVYVGSPNNPTAVCDDPELIRDLRKPGRTVLVDESFMDFVSGPHAEFASCRSDGIVVLRSLTKLWSLPGVRAGYLLADAALVAALAAAQQPWPVNSIALAAIEICATEPDVTRQTARAVASLRVQLADELGRIPGVRVFASGVNFLLLQVEDGPSITAALLQRNIVVRPAADFVGLDANFLRVAVRPAADNQRLVQALVEAVGC